MQQHTLTPELVEANIAKFTRERDLHKNTAETTNDPFAREMALLGHMEAKENLFVSLAAKLLLEGKLDQAGFHVVQERQIQAKLARCQELERQFAEKRKTESDTDFLKYIDGVLSNVRREMSGMTHALDQIGAILRDSQ